MQLEMGMSTSRYLPASGTAGLARSLVSGKSRVPWPPPMMTHRTLLVLSDWRPVCAIKFLPQSGGIITPKPAFRQVTDWKNDEGGMKNEEIQMRPRWALDY